MFFLRFFLFLVRAYDPLVSKLRIFAIEWLVVLEREQDGEGFKEIEEREREREVEEEEGEGDCCGC